MTYGRVSGPSSGLQHAVAVGGYCISYVAYATEKRCCCCCCSLLPHRGYSAGAPTPELPPHKFGPHDLVAVRPNKVGGTVQYRIAFLHHCIFASYNC